MDKQRKIEKVREALAKGRVNNVEFYGDGSGASFYYYDPTGDHGCPCTVMQSFNICDALRIIAGFRFAQHELRKCC